jgi:hypothetical protein
VTKGGNFAVHGDNHVDNVRGGRINNLLVINEIPAFAMLNNSGAGMIGASKERLGIRLPAFPR